MEEISQLGQVTCIPCSVSEQKGLHFPESAPAGHPSQVSSDRFIAGCSVAPCSHPTTVFKGALFKLCSPVLETNQEAQTKQSALTYWFSNKETRYFLLRRAQLLCVWYVK